MKPFLLFLSLLLFSSGALPAHRHHHHSHIHSRHQQIIVTDTRPNALKGSPDSRIYENTLAILYGLRKFETAQAVLRAVNQGELVPLPSNRFIVWHQKLEPERAYCLPFAADGLETFAEAFYREFGRSTMPSSAVRPLDYQIAIAKGGNHNAAPAYGLGASTHPTGATIDISYKNLSRREIGWIERYFVEMNRCGKTHAIKEWHQQCFHIMFLPSL